MKQLSLPGIEDYDALEEDRKLMLAESEKYSKIVRDMFKKMRNITPEDLKTRVR